MTLEADGPDYEDEDGWIRAPEGETVTVIIGPWGYVAHPDPMVARGRARLARKANP